MFDEIIERESGACLEEGKFFSETHGGTWGHMGGTRGAHGGTGGTRGLGCSSSAERKVC